MTKRLERAGTELSRDKFFSFQVSHSDEFSQSPRMTLGYDKNHFVVPNLFEGEPYVVALKSDDAKLYLAVEQIFDDPRRITNAQDRLHLRILFRELAKFL